MKTKFVEKEFAYDGAQLHSLFGYMEHGLAGDSAVAWIGSCSIPFANMADGEDVVAGATIAGDRMVHFIIEKFHAPLIAGVALQRLFAAIVLDLLRENVLPAVALRLSREGDDLYLANTTANDRGKLSISIATVSPISTLIHFAINCTNSGTPVKTACLTDLSIDPVTFAREALRRLENEVNDIDFATVKVRCVK
jgi:uncharacterized protein